MTMRLFKKGNKKRKTVTENAGTDAAARWIADRLSCFRRYMLRKLERLDRNMTNQQRKWAFYTGMLLWSGCLLYLLGTAVRRPPGQFVLPFVPDTSAVAAPENAGLIPGAEETQPTGTLIIQPQKIKTHGRK